MANSCTETKVAIDTCLLLDIFLHESELGELTMNVSDSPRFPVYLPPLLGIEAVATPAMRGDQQHPPIDNEYIRKAKEFLSSAAVL
ncbi:hypothetical protein SAMN05660282_02029 [Corynebacterium spheniscorum]|uniref:PIN domain-containing protein n=1 Tax=Corynebacterium spheniscorum TaxID=185761 RepID=A0A1I2UVF7_9CORY|nr:hypothetical protein SAMN05660282_02029 [Corynebacterium spheniscorum]